MLCLAIIPLIIILLLCAVLFIIGKKWKLSSVFFLLSLFLNYFSESIPVNIGFSNECCEKRTFRVLEYNINGWYNYQGGWKEHREDSIIEYIRKSNADIVSIAEFIPMESELIEKAMSKMYPYSNVDGSAGWEIEPLIYSKYPIRNVLRNDHRSNAVDVDVNGRKIRVVTCYLQSNLVSLAGNLSELYEGIKSGYNRRREQIDVMVNSIKDCPFDIVVLGDMNDVAGSYTINSLRDLGLRNAWWEKGNGFGFTFSNCPFYLRLDHIMHSEGIRLKSIKLDNVDYSDHYPLCADFLF